MQQVSWIHAGADGVVHVEKSAVGNLAKNSTQKSKGENLSSKKNRKIREWIDTSVQILILIVMVVGVCQIIKVNVNLEEINAKKVTSSYFEIKGPNGSSCIYDNGTHSIWGRCPNLNQSNYIQQT
jgi:hypothetical protein